MAPRFSTDKGISQDDSGQGAPGYNWDEVRTGYNHDSSTAAGQADCDA